MKPAHQKKPPSPPVAESLHDVKLRLIEAATLLFAEKGFDGVGIREIATKAEANSAMVGYHFGGKEGLYLAALRAGFERCPSRVAQLDPIPRPGHPSAKKIALKGLQDHIRVFVEDLMMTGCDPLMTASSALLMREMAVGGPFLEELNRDFMRPYFTHLRDCIRALRPDWEEVDVLFSMSFIHGGALIYKFIPAIIKLNGGPSFPPDAESLTRFLTEYTLRALGTEKSGKSLQAGQPIAPAKRGA